MKKKNQYRHYYQYYLFFGMYLSDNMMARDSDFMKAKHIITIAQNNEKANQANT